LQWKNNIAVILHVMWVVIHSDSVSSTLLSLKIQTVSVSNSLLKIQLA